MRFSICEFRFLIALLLAGGIVRAEATWTLTTADFNQQGVDLLKLDANGATVLGKTEKTTIPLDNFLEVRRINIGQTTPGKFVLYLNGGDRLAGEPAGTSGEQLKWSSPAVGELALPMNQIRALVKAGQKATAIDETRQEDTVKLANGDAVKGILTDLSAKEAAVQVGNDVSKVPLDAVTAIYFASAVRKIDNATQGFRVGLTDGSTFLARGVSWDAGKVTLTLNDRASRPVDPTRIVSIEQINGPVSWLSSRQPAEIVQIPFLDVPWPTGFDANVTGEPIRFADHTYARGIGVHSYSRLTFALDGAYAAFRTQYAIDGSLPHAEYADVTVRIKLDGKTVHEQPNFKSGVLSKPIVVDLAGAKTLTLEVDYGQGDDIQDRFNWIEPALLKHVPAAQ